MTRSHGFLGVPTDAFAARTALDRDVLGLLPIGQRPGAAWFRAADGVQIHVYDAAGEDHAFFHGPDRNVCEIIGPDGAAS